MSPSSTTFEACDEQAANLAMYSAHRTGRGIIGYFDERTEAEAPVKRIAELGQKALPSALIVTCEECEYHKAPAASEEDGDRVAMWEQAMNCNVQSEWGSGLRRRRGVRR